MSVWLEMLVPAAGLSLLALGCLALLPRAPAELRFSIAAAGLAAWMVAVLARNQRGKLRRRTRIGAREIETLHISVLRARDAR